MIALPVLVVLPVLMVEMVALRVLVLLLVLVVGRRSGRFGVGWNSVAGGGWGGRGAERVAAPTTEEMTKAAAGALAACVVIVQPHMDATRRRHLAANTCRMRVPLLIMHIGGERQGATRGVAHSLPPLPIFSLSRTSQAFKSSLYKQTNHLQNHCSNSAHMLNLRKYTHH